MNQTMNKTMKTVVIDRFGGLNEMKIRALPVPELDANEILVRVEAAGVGVWDPFEREGGFAKEFNMSPQFPIILGSDGAGTVEAVGEKVSRFKKGDRVYGISFMSPKGGFYAEHVVMKETHAARLEGRCVRKDRYGNRRQGGRPGRTVARRKVLPLGAPWCSGGS